MAKSKERIKVTLENIELSKLQYNEGQIPEVPKNPRFIKDEKYNKLKQSLIDDPEMTEIRELIAYDNDGQLVVIGGNMRLRAMRELKWTETLVKIVEAGTPSKKLRAIAIKDNVPFGENDWDMLANEWDVEELQEWGQDLPGFENNVENDEQDESLYTAKIEAPIYHPQGLKPDIKDLYDDERYKEILDKIEKSACTDQEKSFLRLAASRHIVFNYEQIANFYAHSEMIMQEQMEESTLIVIDYNKAIEQGYIAFANELQNLRDE